MATVIVNGTNSGATPREIELAGALDVAIAALNDMQGVLDLIHEEGSIGRLEYPQSVAGAIRMVSHRVDSTMPLLQGVRG